MPSQTIEERIKNTRLTKTERLIAEYILHNYSTVGFKTSTDIAFDLGVSDSSVIRLSRSLGYNGFNELKGEIKSAMAVQLKSGNEFEYSILAPIERFTSNFETLSSEETVTKHLDRVISSVRDVLEKNPMQKFDKCIDILKTSRKKYVCGFRSTSFVAHFFAFELLFLLPDVILSTHADAKAIERMVDITADDCVILFTFPRYGKINSIVKKMAEDVGARVIVVVDKITSPVATGADLVITCNPQSLSFYNSVIPMMFVCEILITEMSKCEVFRDGSRLKLVSKYLDPDTLY